MNYQNAELEICLGTLNEDHSTQSVVQIEKEASTIEVRANPHPFCTWIITTHAPRWKGGQFHEREALEEVYLGILENARNHEIESIAFPAISTGVYHFPLKEAAKIAASCVYSYLGEHPDCFSRLVWVVFDEKTRYVYQRTFEQLLENSESSEDLQ